MAEETAQKKHQTDLKMLNERLGIKPITDTDVLAAGTKFISKEEEKVKSQKEQLSNPAHNRIKELTAQLELLKVKHKEVEAANAKSKDELAEALKVNAQSTPTDPVPALMTDAIPRFADKKLMDNIFTIAQTFQQGIQKQIDALEKLKPKIDSNSYKQLLELTRAKINITEFIKEQDKFNLQKSGKATETITKEKLDYYAKGLTMLVTSTEKALDQIGYPGKFRQFMSFVKNAIASVFNAINSNSINVSHRIAEKEMKAGLKLENVKASITTTFFDTFWKDKIIPVEQHNQKPTQQQPTNNGPTSSP